MEYKKEKLDIQVFGKVNEEYVRELQKFFDIVDNVSKEELKMDIIYQMLKCNKILSDLLENQNNK